MKKFEGPTHWNIKYNCSLLWLIWSAYKCGDSSEYQDVLPVHSSAVTICMISIVLTIDRYEKNELIGTLRIW